MKGPPTENRRLQLTTTLVMLTVQNSQTKQKRGNHLTLYLNKIVRKSKMNEYIYRLFILKWKPNWNHVHFFLVCYLFASFLFAFLAHMSRVLKWTFLITVCALSVVVVVVVVNFSHFLLLLLQNHWANFNQT